MALLHPDNLTRTTEDIDEKFIYALLSEEDAYVEAVEHSDTELEVSIVLPKETHPLPESFLRSRLQDMGWRLDERD